MHNQFKTQKFKHLMLAMGPRDLNSAPYSPVHCSSHSMTSFQSSELTELPVVENSQLFAQRPHSARYAPSVTVTSHQTPKTRHQPDHEYLIHVPPEPLVSYLQHPASCFNTIPGTSMPAINHHHHSLSSDSRYQTPDTQTPNTITPPQTTIFPGSSQPLPPPAPLFFPTITLPPPPPPPRFFPFHPSTSPTLSSSRTASSALFFSRISFSIFSGLNAPIPLLMT